MVGVQAYIEHGAVEKASIKRLLDAIERYMLSCLASLDRDDSLHLYLSR